MASPNSHYNSILLTQFPRKYERKIKIKKHVFYFIIRTTLQIERTLT